MRSGEVPRRRFGRYEEEVSALALGGYHIGNIKSQREAVALIQAAIDEGITFLDNAWEYHEGRSEEVMGKAIADRRDRVFLMTKLCSHGRGEGVAMRQLHQSLRRLQTDHLDLWQIHECVYYNDPERHFQDGGAVDALLKAREQGKVRYIGFTGHKDPAIHLEMLAQGFPFDSCQLPLNGFDATFKSFEQQVLPELHRQGIAPLGMKSLGGDARAVKRRVVKVEDALRYAMSLPVTATISRIDSKKVLRQNLRNARKFTPRSRAEIAAYRKQLEGDAADGRYELYKTTAQHDGDEGREQHRWPTPEELEM